MIDINKLTIGEARELAHLLSPMVNPQVRTEESIFLSEQVGKYAIVRTRNEGINAGKIKKLDHTGVILEDARRIYYHKPKDNTMAWYEGVAMSGLSNDSKVSPVVNEKVIIEDYSLTICTNEAEESIRNHPSQGS